MNKWTAPTVYAVAAAAVGVFARWRVALLALLTPFVLAGGAAAPSEGLGAHVHSIRLEAGGAARVSSAVAVDWCGAGQPTAVDRKPEADYSSFRHVHVTYVIPADAPSRMEELASKIVTDLSIADAWWQREDPSRTIRFDRFAFTGCSTKLGSLDLGFLRLPRPADAYTGDEGIVGMVPELTELAGLSFHKNVVYYDGPSLYGPTVCGTTLVPRNDPVRGGLGGLAFIWLRSLCGQDVGTGNLNAEVVTHELIHGQGFVRPAGSPNECPEPNRGHVCDNELDILYPEATLETTLAAKRLDVNRDDYYDNAATFDDLRESPYLTHLPQQRLRLAVRRTGTASGTVRVTSPVPFDCSGTCTLELDPEAAITLVAAPSQGSRFLRWTGACKGNGACYVTLAGARSVTALFGGTTFRLTVTVFGKGRVSSTPEGVGCAARCSAAFKAGSNVALRAIAVGGHRFAGWAGSCRGKGRCIITLDRDRSAVATFAKAP